MNKKRLAVLTTLVAISLSGGLVYAAPADDAVDTREVVVTATRHAEEVKAVPSAVEVITAEDMKAIGADNLTSALRMATSLNLSEAGMTGNAVQLRGMSTNHTLILVDGKRMAGEDTSVTQNVYALNRLNLSDVERIEIVRGPGSALYGSDAMGGVINIITKRSQEAKTQIGLSAGTKEMSNWYRFDLGQQGKVNASFDMRFTKVRDLYTDASSVDMMPTLHALPPQFAAMLGEEYMPMDISNYETIGEQSNMYGNKQYYNFDLTYDLGNTKELRFGANYAKERLQTTYADSKKTVLQTTIPSQMYPMFNCFPNMILSAGETGWSGKDKKEWYRNDSKGFSLEYTGKTKRGDYQLRTYYSELEKESDLHYYTGKLGSTLTKQYEFDYAKYRQWTLEGRNTMQLNDEHLLTFGAEYTYNDYRGTRLGNRASDIGLITQNGVSRNISEESIGAYAAYIQDEWMIGDKLLVVPALRYDHHNTFGSNVSPKLGMTYNMNDDVRIKANYGKGFKAPTISELYQDFTRAMGFMNVTVYGNPDLEPEESTSYDISIEAEKGKNFGKLTYFNNDVKNLISSEKLYGFTYQYVNIDEASINGIETELGRHINDRLTLRLVHTYLDATDDGTGERLSNRAKNTTSLRLEYNDHKEDAFGVMLWNDYVSDYYDGENNYDYNCMNICFTKEFGNVEAYFGIDNLLNKEVDDLYIDGRQWRLGVSVTL